MPLRYDTIRIDALERVPHTGALRVPGNLTRPGVFTYHDQNGKAIREYRPPEEVYHADSLATYEDAPVTIGHPKGGVSPDNVGALAVGHVRAGSVKPNPGVGVGATLVVARGDAIGKVERKDVHDISMGYDVDLDETPGVTPDGQAYDRVQRRIRVNHAALLRRGDGRMGAQCALRLDGADEQIPDMGEPTTGGPANPIGQPIMKIKIKRADGSTVEVESGSAEHIAHLEARADALQARVDGYVKAEAERDARAAAEARSKLEATAKTFGVETTRKDGDKEVALTDRAIKVAVIKRTDSSFDDAGRDDVYVSVRFDMACQPAAAASAKVTSIAGGLNGAPPPAASPAVVRADASGACPDLETDPEGYADWHERRADAAWRPAAQA